MAFLTSSSVFKFPKTVGSPNYIIEIIINVNIKININLDFNFDFFNILPSERDINFLWGLGLTLHLSTMFLIGLKVFLAVLEDSITNICAGMVVFFTPVGYLLYETIFDLFMNFFI